MKLDFTGLSAGDSYRWMTQLVVPRPIAWVSTVDEDGHPNLAPFSWFQTVSSSPAILMLALAQKRNKDGSFVDKDTLNNLKNQGQCVIQLAQRDQISALVSSSAPLKPNECEFEFAGLEKIPSDVVKAPRVAGALVAFECELEEIMRREHWNTDLVMVRVLLAHIAPELVNSEGEFSSDNWNPISRLGKLEYAEIGEKFDQDRPSLSSKST